ncbi:MAG: radical SAM protein [Candidatus Omnitrophota bacterium]|nr:radical SAM protein [Candidatus Omnitrophota bacterium]
MSKILLFPTRPAYLTLYVTNRCTLRCKTCFLNFDKPDKNELTLPEIDKIAFYLRGLIWLDITGGEPFLRKDLPDICAKFDTYSLTIPTNGFDPALISEMTQEIRKRTSAVMNIAVSIDGFEATHDEIRSKGSFQRAIETLKLLKQIKGIKVRIITVLCERNYDETIDFMRFIKTFDIDFHSINFRRGPATISKYSCPSVEKLEEIKENIFRIWKTYDYGFKTLEGKILRNYQQLMYETSLRIIKEKRQIPSCLAGKYHSVIWANGDYSFCEMLEPFGNIREEDIGLLLKSKKAEKVRRSIRDGKCYCYHNCNMIDNFFLNPLHYPKLLRGAWKWSR